MGCTPYVSVKLVEVGQVAADNGIAYGGIDGQRNCFLGVGGQHNGMGKIFIVYS